MNTIEIKTDLSGEELQVLIWELEAFCEKNRLQKPVLQQCSVSGSLDNYWKNRCIAAEKFIKESPCDPDIYDAQIKAYDERKDIVNISKPTRPNFPKDRNDVHG